MRFNIISRAIGTFVLSTLLFPFVNTAIAEEEGARKIEEVVVYGQRDEAMERYEI